jgi:hypothetical protein
MYIHISKKLKDSDDSRQGEQESQRVYIYLKGEKKQRNINFIPSGTFIVSFLYLTSLFFSDDLYTR